MFKKNEFEASLKRKGWTKAEFARRIGIDSATLYRKIRKEGHFTREECEKIRDVIGKDEADAFLFAK